MNKLNRKSLRLKHWDYSNCGYYFVTICTKDCARFFGEIRDANMIYSDIGRTANEFWQEIPEHFEHVDIDEFVIMPDHMHGIVIINENMNSNLSKKDVASPRGDVAYSRGPRTDVACNVRTGEGNDCALNLKDMSTNRYVSAADIELSRYMSLISPKQGSLSAIIRSYKSAVTRWCGLNGFNNFAWQPRFWDRIIRDDKELYFVRRYIRQNIIRWEK